jgi:DNA-binding MarR family transcriptional regulator
MGYRANHLSVSPGHLVYRIHVLLRRRVDHHFSAAGIDVSMEEYPILNALWHEDGKNQQDLAEVIGKDRARTSRLIDQLEAKNLVVRKPHPDNRREKLVCLTGQGNTIKRPVEEAIDRAIGDGFGALTAAEYNDLIQKMQGIVERYSALG